MIDLDCNEVVELVTAYLDGALDESKRGDVETHLAGCDGCREHVAQIRSTASGLRDTGATGEDLPDDVRAELLRDFRNFPR